MDRITHEGGCHCANLRWRCETADYPQIKRVSPLCEYEPPVPKIAGAPAAPGS